jgi:hypothetical protein
MENGMLIAEHSSPPSQHTCGTCKHIQRWECNSKHFFYCGVTPDGRTENGLLKVKCKTQACAAWKSEEAKDEKVLLCNRQGR